MYGNTPYAGKPSDGKSAELSPAGRRALREGVFSVEKATRRYLPDEYQIGSHLGQSGDRPQVRISVKPPVGNPVSAGFTPDAADEDDPIPVEDVEEVAQGLAASAALQVKQAMDEELPPTAG